MARQLALIAVLLLFGFAAARPKWNELEGYTFDQYIKHFGKAHQPGTAEFEQRKALFEGSLAKVRQHNAEGHSWKKGINKFSDWTEAEMKKLRGNKVAMKKTSGSKPERIHEVPAGADPLPKFVDWRNNKPSVISAVKDQGQCGSCWAHAATESIESHIAIATGELFALSQQQITSCTPDPQECGGTGGCAGAIAELAFDYIKGKGQQQEWTYPYTSYTGNSGTCQTITEPVINISGYTKVAHNDADAVAHALAHAGPLAISVDASHWSDYETGVYSGCSYNISMDHAVQAVGYGFDYGLGLDYWIVRNSWSPAWGEAGYIRLLRTPGKTDCGWNVNPQDGDGCKGQTAPEWACGMCGIAYDTLYPNFAPLA
jgi:cathepsin L